MKKITLILSALFIGTTIFTNISYSQNESANKKALDRDTEESSTEEINSSSGTIHILWYRKGWFIDGNAGIRALGKTTSAADMGVGLTANGGIGYMFNEKFGLKGRADYHKFVATTATTEDISHSGSLSLEGVVKLLQVFGKERPRDFALNFHAGAGLTNLFNPANIKRIKDEGGEFGGPGIKTADNIFHVIVGITPQYHFNSRISLNLDISHFFQFKQFKTYDLSSNVKVDGPTGVFAVSMGLTFRLE